MYEKHGENYAKISMGVWIKTSLSAPWTFADAEKIKT